VKIKLNGKKMKELRERVEEYEREKAHVETQIGEKTNQIETEQHHKSYTTDKWHDANLRVEAMKLEVDNAINMNAPDSNHPQRNHRHKAQFLETAHRNHGHAVSNFEELEKQIIEHNETIVELSDDITRYTEAKERLDERIADLNKEVEKLKRENEKLKEREEKHTENNGLGKGTTQRMAKEKERIEKMHAAAHQKLQAARTLVGEWSFSLS